MTPLDPKLFSVCLATPHGSPLSSGTGYVKSVRRAVFELEKRAALVEFGDEIPDVIVVDARESVTRDQDLVRTRSRLLRAFVEQGRAEWLWWQDDDVSFGDPASFVTMLTLGVQCDLDAVGAIVPRKYHDEAMLVANLDWALGVLRHRVSTDEQIAAANEVIAHPLRYAFGPNSFAIRKLVQRPEYTAPHPALWRVDQLGLGCCLMRRRAVEAFLSAYREELGTIDPYMPGTTVAGFLLEIDDDRALLSEDNSFWRRWGALGLTLHAYIGPGSDRFVHTGATDYSASLTCLFGGPGKVSKS